MKKITIIGKMKGKFGTFGELEGGVVIIKRSRAYASKPQKRDLGLVEHFFYFFLSRFGTYLDKMKYIKFM